jgi:hypothetical protein
MVEGKGFVYLTALSIRYFVAVILQSAANCCDACARALSANFPDICSEIRGRSRSSRLFRELPFLVVKLHFALA